MLEQMIIEHSEPGFVITLSDDLENTLRNLSWEQIEKLRQELVRLARQTSAECGRALEAFHIETPGEVGASIPSLATLENVDRACVEGSILSGLTFTAGGRRAASRRANITERRLWASREG